MTKDEQIAALRTALEPINAHFLAGQLVKDRPDDEHTNIRITFGELRAIYNALAYLNLAAAPAQPAMPERSEGRPQGGSDVMVVDVEDAIKFADEYRHHHKTGWFRLANLCRAYRATQPQGGGPAKAVDRSLADHESRHPLHEAHKYWCQEIADAYIAEREASAALRREVERLTENLRIRDEQLERKQRALNELAGATP